MGNEAAATSERRSEVTYKIRPVTHYELWRHKFLQEGNGMCSGSTELVGTFETEDAASAIREWFEPAPPPESAP